MSGKKGSKHINGTEHFLSIINSIASNDSGCLIWPLGLDKDGYGYYSIKGKIIRAHRLLYTLTHECEMENFVVMHSCDIRSCCNINHLSLGTVAQNTKDMVRKNRHAKGSQIGTSKLNEKESEQIRDRHPRISAIELAEEYGVCKQTIYNVLNGTTFVNASHVNEHYDPIHSAIRIIL